MPDITNETLNYVSIILASILPVILIYYFKTIERRRSEKEARVAAELKIANEKTANELKLASVEIADKLKIHLDDKINDINKSIEDLSKRIELVTNSQSEITKRVDNISEKQVETNKNQLELIYDLQSRADMTNGNIKNIRNDIMDVQESVEDVSDNLMELPPLNTKKRERRVKRRQITDDADYQDNVKHKR